MTQVLFVVLAAVFLAWSIFLYAKYKKLKKAFRAHKKALRHITKTINSVRYGNIYERSDAFSTSVLPVFSQQINRMIEAFVDREDMIKEYQNDLNAQIEAQKEIQKLKEDFAATLTHDLKVPIIAEKNMLNFLYENKFGELNEQQKAALRHLKNSNMELVELVEILLETYKLNETDIKLNKEKTDVKRQIEEVILQMQPIAEASGVEIVLNSGFDGTIDIDGFYIKRVLKNLLLNAISFSPSGLKVEVELKKSRQNIEIKIKNHGNTIQDEDIPHIFDKYYTTSNKFRKVGTGLGLYLSNKIIKAHDGVILPESDFAANTTTITVRLPYGEVL